MKKRAGVVSRVWPILFVLTLLAQAARTYASNGAWTGAESAAWTNDANWSAAPYAGAAAGETATFDGAGGGNTTLDLDGLASLLNVAFNTSSTAAYTLGTGGVNAQSLTLENAGAITLGSTAGAAQAFDATILLGTSTAGATYTLRNDSINHILTFAGDVAAPASGGTPGTKTLNLSGYGKIILAGVLSSGGATALSLNSYGTNTLSGNNTFAGNIVVYDGTLRLTHSNALGTGTKTASANNNVSGRNPSFVLDGSAGDLTLPADVTFQTSNSRAGAVINEAGNNTILGNFILTGGDGATHIWSKGGKLTIVGNMTPNTTLRVLYLRGDSDGEISGVIANGSTSALPVNRDVGSGTWTLSGANTFSGAATVSAGTLALAGSAGSISASSSITVSDGATLILTNTATANHANRLKDTAPVNLSSATFVFANDGSEASFSETAGTLTLVSGLSTIIASQAAAGQTSALTFADLSYTEGAAVNFKGVGIGADDRNRIFITGLTDGPIGSWATINGTIPAYYSSTLGVYAGLTQSLAAKGDTIVSNATSDVVIDAEGTTGPNELSDSITVINSLIQGTAYGSVANTADKTLRVGTVKIASGMADLTLGVAPNEGTLSASTEGGALVLINNSDSDLTVNAVVADYTNPSSLAASGTGTVILSATNTFSGTVAVGQGQLKLADGLALQNATLTTGGLIFDSAVASHAFAVGNITNAFSQTLEDTAANAVTLTVGGNNADSSYGGGLTGAGTLAKAGGGTLALTGANTHAGGTTIQAGTVAASQSASLGTGPIINNGTLNLTVANTTYSGLSTSLSGSGTVNVALGSGSNTQYLDGDYSAFTGVWNLGIGGTGGKARMNGADNPSATVNVLSNGSVHVSQPVTHNAAAVLNGGTTGESYGQMRLEGFAEWAGPVTLAGDCLDPAKGFFGSTSGTGTISGVISDLNGAHPVNKVGGSTIVLSAPNSTYAGQTWVRSGTLLAATIKNVGEASSLGQPANATDGAIKLGYNTSGTRLTYIGTGDISDRVLDLAGTTNTVYLDQSGSGLMKYTGDFTYSGAGNKTLYLQGSTDGEGELAGVYANGGIGANKLIKNGTGRWTLSNANTYSGETEVQDGTLALAHPNALSGTSQIKFTGTSLRNAVLELANDGIGEDEKNITIGVGYNGTVASGVGAGDSVGINHSFNEFSLSFVTLTVTRAASVLSGAPTITAKTLNLSGGNTYTTTIKPTTADIRLGRVAILANSQAKTVRLDGTSQGNVITGQVYNGLNTLSVLKENSSTWTLQGSNTYSGATTVNNGTLVLEGVDGAITASSGFTVNAGGTLRLSNTPTENRADRLADAKGVTLTGGTLDFAHTAGAADYSETVGAVSVGGDASTISASQADAEQTCALTLSALSLSGNGTLDFVGTGLGEDARNRIFITGLPDGLIGFWSTYNGSGLAAYDSVKGVCAGSSSEAEIAARGPLSVIPDDATTFARITATGEVGAVTLAGATVNSVAALQQEVDTPAVIDTTGKTLRTQGINIAAGQATLTVGASPGSGTLTALAAGGKLDLGNNSTNTLTINAAIADNASASTLAKTGAGDVLLNGPCTYTGSTLLGLGSLILASDEAQTLNGVISGIGSLVKEGTNVLHLMASNTYTGPTYINKGIVQANQNLTFGTSAGGVFIADGATLDVGCTPDVGGTRGTNSINLGYEVFTVSGSGVNGMGAIVNNSLVSQYGAFGKITLAGDTTVGGTQRWDLRYNTPALTLNDHTLTKVGPNTVGLTSANVYPGSGHIDVQQGLFRLESSTKLNGDAANTLTVRAGAEFELYKVSNLQYWHLNLEDGSTFDAGNSSDNSGQNRWAGPITLGGSVTLIGASGYYGNLLGDIDGSGPLTKTGSANIAIYGPTNTYTGATLITAGTLTISNLCSVGIPCSLGQPANATDGTIKIGSGTTSATLTYKGTGDTSDRIIDLAGTTGGATIYQSGNGMLTLSGGVTASGNGNKTLTLRGTGNGAISGSIANPTVGKVAITKSDTGTWALSGNNAYTGDVSISNGRLILAGQNAQGQGAMVVASSAANGVLRLESGCVLTSIGNTSGAGGIRVGNTGAAHGALYVAEGASIYRTPKTGDDLAFTVGRAAGSYGYFNMSGGEMTTTRIQTGLSGTSSSNTVGNVRMTGGTLTLPDYMLIARGKGSVSAFTVEGGTINHTNASNNLSIGYEGGRGELNLIGGTLESYGKYLTVRQSANNSTGIINLCSGMLSIDLFQNTAPGVGLLNFAGGTLKAGNINSTVFIPTSMSGVFNYGPFGTFAGGAVIDSAGRDIKLAAPMQAPAGNGVYAITLADKGSGYIGEPYVAINGDGLGATAVANMEDDETGNGTYRVVSVTVTCPGTSYTTPPEIYFNGGGRGAVPPTVDAVTIAPNTSGGLTKTGNGTLTLGAANTYGGTTTVGAGTLKLGHAAALPSGAQVTLSGGTLDLSGYVVTNAVNGSGTLMNGTMQTVLSPAGEGAVGTDTLALSGISLQGLYLADVTSGGASDHVAIQGDINLSGLTLQIVDPDVLDRQKTYTILTCTGVRTGTISATNLPDSRWHVTYLADGTAKLLYAGGTLIKLK